MNGPIWGMMIFSWVGFVDATFLSAKYYMESEVPCLVVQGCEQVLTSSYATTLGIPNALLGSIFFGVVFLGAFAYWDLRRKWILDGLWWTSILGVLASLWLVGVQIFVISAYCSYCLLSAGMTLGIFLTCGYLKRIAKRGGNPG